MKLRHAAVFALGGLVPLVATSCPSINPNLGLGGGGATGSGGNGGNGGQAFPFGGSGGSGGFSHGGAGTVGPGGSFGVGGMPTTTTSTSTGSAGCLTCAQGLQQGGGGVCPGLPSDAYNALAACACAVTAQCYADCKTSLCKNGPAGLQCESCFVSACPNEQADCAVN